MAPKIKARAPAGTKRKHEELKNEPEDIISSDSGSDLTEDEYQDNSEDEYDERPPKSKKGNGKSTPSKPKETKKPKEVKESSLPKGKVQTKKREPSNKKISEKEKDMKATKKRSKSKSKDIDKEVKPPRIKTKNPEALLEYLLSDEALDYANPSPERGYGEVDWSKHTSPSNPKSAPNPLPKPNADSVEKGKSSDVHPAVKESNEKEGYIRYPHSPLTPFQTLVCSLLLSKPLSHKLGIRTISTLLNPPFNFGKFEILQQADEKRCLESLFKARTQHKEKTAVQLLDLVEGVRGLNGEGEEDTLNGIKRAIENLHDVEKSQQRVGDMLRSIKGIGPVGVGIFSRRIQGQWNEVFPYVDQRCLDAAKSIGLIGETQGAKEMGKLVGDDSAKLVRLLDVLIGLDLEKKLDGVLEKYP